MALPAGEDEESDLDADAPAAAAGSSERAAQERRAEQDRARAAAGTRRERSSRAAYEEALRSLQGQRAQLEQKLRELAVMQRELESKLGKEPGRAGSPSPAGEAERAQAEAEMRAARAALDGQREAVSELERMREAERLYARVERQGIARNAEEERAEREFVESVHGDMAQAEKELRLLMGQQGAGPEAMKDQELRLEELHRQLEGVEGARASAAAGSRAAMDREIAALHRALALQEKNLKKGDSEQAVRELRERLRELEGARKSSTRVE